MKAFLTGAGGFMGPHLGRFLKEQGFELMLTYFEPISDLEELRTLGETIELDVRDKEKFKELLARFKPDRVYHLAAQSYPTVSWERPNYTIQANVEGTINLFECLKALEQNPIVMVAGSSAEYGFVTEDEVPIKESHSLKPLHPYGVSKVAQEMLTYQYFKNFGLKGFTMRIFNTTGPGKVNDVCADFTKQAVMIEKGLQEPIFRVGNLNTRRAITDVRDEVRSFYLATEKCESGEAYNVSGENVYQMQELLDKILEITGIKVEIKVDPKLLRPTDEPIIYGDSSKLKEKTDWQQEIPIEQTLKDMIEFWRKKLK
ncbi:MAG: GDP-mannose 4,6-dehydratase [Nanoarchaeota archaeon]|nr:GDP-mannose 4,6-dehydratase [Nanoarchaeota archaeon]